MILPFLKSRRKSGPAVLNFKNVLWLFTPQHTGTHFCRLLLEIHPRVSPCVFWNGKDHFHYRGMQIQFLRKKIPLETWKNVLASSYAEKQASLFQDHERNFRELGIALQRKKPPYDFLFFHDHISPKTFSPSNPALSDPRQLPVVKDQFRQIKTVVTLRDPLLAILSALRRTRRGAEEASIILRGIRFVMDIPEAFFFCTDLWMGQPAKALDVFSYLGLEAPPQAGFYLGKYTVVNRTQSASESARGAFSLSTPEDIGFRWREFYPRLTEEDLRELRIAREWLIEKKAVHPVLKKWAELLREHKEFEAFYKKLGYRDLAWFKD